MPLLALLPLLLAADHELFGKPVFRPAPPEQQTLETRREGFERMLDERGWVQIDDQVRPAAEDGSFAQPIMPQAAWSSPPHRSTIFLNFFGTESLKPGTNSDLDESSCLQGEMPWPGFGGTEQQALALIEIFEVKMAPYGVRIAYDERPPSHLPYAMVMMGGSPNMLGLGNGVLGVSCSSDCGDLWWRDTTFAFTDAINPNNADVLGTTALHEAAHAFGLAHIDDATRIMNPFVGSGDVDWANTCTPYNDATGGINCQPTHDEFCGGGAQNSDAELLAYFGENSPDIEPPVVEILSPVDGTELEVGGSVMVEAEITDDHEGVGWKLVLPEVGQESVAYQFEKSWPLGNLPAGVYTLRVEAIDHDRNEAFDEVTIYVGVDAPAGTSGSGGDSEGGGVDSSGSGGGEDGTGSSDAGATTDVDGGNQDASTVDKEGCACAATTPSPRTPSVLLAAGLLMLRRRRRSCVAAR
ncbi:MAG: hypothetical protein IPK74_06325 [Deltaproteobacteria bacterium]|nr:hypothetical protein [Deltaproteobacteria bacterium]